MAVKEEGREIMIIDGIKFQGDGAGGYDILAAGARLIKGVPGLTCEIGVYGGESSVTVMKACQENGDKRIHVGIDPWGNIEYRDRHGIVRHDYTNEMKQRAFRDVYTWCYATNQECSFFAMTDIEFFERFESGVPIHNYSSSLVNQYAYVYIDGPHHFEAIATAIEFFEPRTPVGGVWQVDNTDHYDHTTIHAWVLEKGFADISGQLGTVGGKMSYQRKELK